MGALADDGRDTRIASIYVPTLLSSNPRPEPAQFSLSRRDLSGVVDRCRLLRRRSEYPDLIPSDWDEPISSGRRSLPIES